MKKLLERIKFVAVVDLQTEGAAQEKEQCPDICFRASLKRCVCVCVMLIYASVKAHICYYEVHNMPSGVL